jgi:hypothetical protein
MRRLATICVAAVAAGCEPPPQAAPCSGGTCSSERTVEQVFQRTQNRSLDILFVVDDSAAIAPYQADLPAGFATLAGQLAGFPGGVPELHAGFVSASGCAGSIVTRAGSCGVTPPAQFIDWSWCGQHTDLAGTLDTAFSCLGDFGVTSCTTSQPLSAMRRVLQQPTPEWAAFLRPDAPLLVVIVAGQDDASPGPVSDTVQLLRSLKTDPDNLILVTVIFAPPAGSACAFDPATAPPRLMELAKSFGANGLVDLLCSDGVRNALLAVSFSLAVFIDPPCLVGVRDNDPATPGVQADCAVVETTKNYDGSMSTTVLPSCDVAAPPCWSLGPSSVFLGCAGGLTFSVTHAADYCSAEDPLTKIQCVGCLDPADPACAAPPL